ncbi:Clavaminate synthase-like protein, partial [Rhizodiscina lignyota]
MEYKTPKHRKGRKLQQTTVCGSCNYSPNAVTGEMESWLQCNGCKSWFHYICAGFKNEREVRTVDKFHCKDCKPKFGPTTRVRQSARAHNSIDYAKLQDGEYQTADDVREHRYIAPIKYGEFSFTPETFPRMPPELVTAEYFQKCRAMTEPIVIPASLNPRPKFPGTEEDTPHIDEPMLDALVDGEMEMEIEIQQERVPDVGQDKLGMVIPQGLTVRRVAELYGKEEKLPVIDVKSQESQDWKLSKWADYYEDETENKPVRNVISLEVSRSRLGRLIRRPDVVRDLDLADAVWPVEDGSPPKVQFYVLMSVTDCFTDFHIDFGGSSVYYHILKGKKTFFFIPPKKSYLKQYEDWNKTQSQHHVWLGNETKECYRVDLSEGDTMLIPSGWIHAVWTPENSLVIGGNFLTRLHYGNQIRIAEIERNTKVAQKFRYPNFQKVMWFAVLQYLKTDPLPPYVEAILMEGKQFPREAPIWREYNKFGHNSDPGREYYNARYYSQAELDGLPELVSFIFRTVMIMLGRVDGVTVDQQKAVIRSIPKQRHDMLGDGSYEPLNNARLFAMWVAWKRGNENIPEWAYPDAALPERDPVHSGKKLSVAALRRMERQKALELHHAVNPDIRSARQRSKALNNSNDSRASTPAAFNPNHFASPKNSVLGPKRSACDACRRRRVGCKHKDEVRDALLINGQRLFEFVAPGASSGSDSNDNSNAIVDANASSASTSTTGPTATTGTIGTIGARTLVAVEIPARVPVPESDLTAAAPVATPERPATNSVNVTATPMTSGGSRNKACANCRKSKRKCLHDENGNLDLSKLAESSRPRVFNKKRKSEAGG